MADKVYQGGIPQGGFNANMSNAGFSVSSEGESSETPGGPASRPGVVKEGGSTEGKTGTGVNHESSFLLDPSYKGDMAVGRPTSSDVDNPDDISHADHDTDEDHPSK